MHVLPYLVIFVRQPIFLAEALLLGAILSGLGRAFGVPMLFWDQRKPRQFLAGLAVGLFMCDGVFVAYALEPIGRSRALRLDLLLIESPLALLIGVGVAWSIRHLAPGSSDKKRSPVAPMVNSYEAGESTPSVPEIPVWPFLTGSLLAVLVALLIGRFGSTIPVKLTPPMAIFVLVSSAFVVFYTTATPAVAICLLFALVLGAYGGLEHCVNSPGAALAIVLIALGVAGVRLYKVRLPRILKSSAHPECDADPYADPLPYPPSEGQAAACVAELLAFDVGLETWATRRADPRPAPLIVVCVSGGGIRAAAWTAGILGLIDNEIPEFRSATRLLTGASGGGVGAATWSACALAEGEKARPEKLIAAVAADSLTPAVRSLVFHDIPLAFVPAVNHADRGAALERAWRDNVETELKVDLSVPIAAFQELEKEARLPSLVFSPMIVEDGRRLIVSNLDLSPVTDNRVRWLSSAKPLGPDADVASRTAYHVCQVVRGGARLPLSTAARLAAAFPFVSPAIVLPTKPRCRVVDAGYFDNYGLDLACAWLRQLAEKHGDGLKKLVSKVLVIQVRDNVSNLSINPDSDVRQRAPRHGALLRGLEGLTSPPEGFAAARDSVMLFRNDEQLSALAQIYKRALDGPDALSTTVFEFSGEASLSWHLTNEERDAIRSQVSSSGIGGKVDAIKAWLAA